MHRRQWIASLTLLSVCLPVYSAAICDQLYPPQVDWTALSGAVLRLEGADANDSGTGYLISASQGYVLTAAHVVKAPGPNGTIKATSPWRPGIVFDAVIVSDLSGTPDAIDAALLQIRDTSQLADIRPVDISLAIPSAQESLLTMGYPKFGDLPNDKLQHASLADPAFVPSSGNIQVNDAIAKPGASGSPLINGEGSTVGTATATLGVQQVDAWFIPMVSLKPLLDLIPPSAEATKLNGDLQGGAVSQAQLTAELQNTSRVTNLDLYELVGLLKKSGAKRSSTSALMRCPLSYALLERGLGELVVDMSEADVFSKASANLQLAQRDIALGNPVLAVSHSENAIDGYQALHDSEGVLAGKLTLAQAQYQSDALVPAKETLSSVLANIERLPAPRRGDAYLLQGNIDAKSGNVASAKNNFSLAATSYVSQNQLNRAALAKRLTAGVDLREGATQAAQASSSDAIQLYKATGNVHGQAELLYERAKVQAATGDKAGLKDSATQYIKLTPDGLKSSEMKAVLNNSKVPSKESGG